MDDERPGGWTLDTLNSYITAILDERDKRYHERFEAQQHELMAALLAQKESANAAISAAKDAVTKAETANDKRFDSVNEFRAALADQQTTLLTKMEYATAHETLVTQINALSGRIADSATRHEAEMAHKVLTDRLNDIAARIDRIEGVSTGVTKSWGYLVAILGIALSIAGVLIVVLK